MPIDLPQWRHLLAVAEHGSFVRAAAAVGLSQPALSRSIQNLERELGAPMFDRTSSGSVPTDLGRLTIARARDLVRMADDLDREARTRREVESGHVTVGGGPFPSETVLIRAAAAFSDRHPNVSLHLPSRTWEDLLRMLRSRVLDFFLAERSMLDGETDVEVEALGTEHPLFFFARVGHPLVERGDLSVADVFDWSVIASSRIPPRVLDPLLRSRDERRAAGGTIRPFPSIECGSVGMQIGIVERSDAIAVSPIEVVAEGLEQGRLALLATEPWLHLRYGIVRLAGRPLTSAAERFRGFVVEAEAEATRAEMRLLERWVTPGGRSRRPQSGAAARPGPARPLATRRPGRGVRPGS
ncbi:LysR family transcriptional regulator [bacterium]|nr:LysR family transcriptional regulator [bacterium]